MTYTALKYPLSGGFIHHWLAAGPVLLPDCSSEILASQEAESLLALISSDPVVAAERIDLGWIGGFGEMNPPPTWGYYRCREDHYVDFTVQNPLRQCQVSYCAVILKSPAAQEVNLTLTASGLADLWLNRQHIYRLGEIMQPSPQSASFPVALCEGKNDILIRIVSSGAQGSLSQCAVRLNGASAGEIETEIPTRIEPDYLPYRIILEEVAEAAYLDRYVYGYMDGDHYHRNQPIPLRFSPDLQASGEITYRMQSLAGDIFQEGTGTFRASSSVEMARKFPLRSGPHHLALLPTANLYYNKNVRFERKALFYVVRTPYSGAVSSSWRERKASALQDAATRRGRNLFSEVAKIATRQWDQIDEQIVKEALARVEARANDSAMDLLGFLGMLARFGSKRRFSKTYGPAISRAAIGFDYTPPASGSIEGQEERQQILHHTCEILAGTLFPEATFTISGKTGRDHCHHGVQKAISWMRARGKYGFRGWDSPETIEATVAALTHLVDLVPAPEVSDLAVALLDKIFFSLAVNSFNGAYTSSRGSSDTASLFSARLAATSGITRLLWGLGNFNDAVSGTVSLACCSGYRLPGLIARIAKNPPPVMWSREQHSLPDGSWRVNKVSYRTADTMLSSAQDYYPGQKGLNEHIWQATLGPDALVFTNHPTSMSETDSHSPNLWRGNGVLPRVAQWGDVLIAVYRLPEDDWMGFTHAYFPAAAFDETHFTQGWAFARVGSGYLALTAARGFDFITTGQTAYRELRSHGRQNTWLCHMGQALLDGSFAEFQQKILAADLQLLEQSARLQTLRGDLIEFGWEGSLRVNGAPQPLDDFPHIENPYCSTSLPASQIDILTARSGMRLNFD